MYPQAFPRPVAAPSEQDHGSVRAWPGYPPAFALPQRNVKQGAQGWGKTKMPPVRHGRIGQVPWGEPMGTDISFIRTSTFPESMEGDEHGSRRPSSGSAPLSLSQSSGEAPRQEGEEDRLVDKAASLVMQQIAPAIQEVEKKVAGGAMRLAKGTRLNVADYGFAGDYPEGNPEHE